MSYNIRLRCRAIEYWDEGDKETGGLEAKKRGETWRKIEPQRFRECIKLYPDAYLREIAGGVWLFRCCRVEGFEAVKDTKKD